MISAKKGAGSGGFCDGKNQRGTAPPWSSQLEGVFGQAAAANTPVRTDPVSFDRFEEAAPPADTAQLVRSFCRR